MDNNRITGVGIAKDLPEKVTYFQEACLLEDLSVPSEKPDIDNIISVMVDAQIMDYKLIETPIALSYEGQNLSGQKLVVEVILHEKVRYVADSPCQSIHAFHNSDTMKSLFVVIPSEIDGVRVCDLIRKRKFSVTPYVEDIYSIKKDCRTVTNYVTLLVDVKFY